MNKITSLDNQKVKQAIKLRKASKRKKQELIIVEGIKEIEMAAVSKIELTHLFLCSEYIRARAVPSSIDNNIIVSVNKAVFNKMSLREKPDGFLALAKPRYLALSQVKLSLNPLLVILETVEKPGNLGAILRSAQAAGVDAVIVTEAQTDIYNSNVIRASRGTVFSSPPVVTSNEKALKWLQDNGITGYAATANTNNLYTEANFRNSTAIIVGTEHAGLSEFWLKKAKNRIKIPMLGKIDSLNASISTAVILFEAIRQRRS